MRRLRLFTPHRWSAAAPILGTRADVVRHLAQVCADAAASLEGLTVRELPVLQPDLLLADQLAVTGDDLLRAGPSPDRCAEAVAHLLLHRWHVLGEEPPATLGGLAVLETGLSACPLP